MPFNINPNVFDVFWDKFGSDAELILNTKPRAIRVIDLSKVNPQLLFENLPGTDISPRAMMSYSNLHKTFYIRACDMVNVTQGTQIVVDEVSYYVIDPRINIVGIGEVIVSKDAIL